MVRDRDHLDHAQVSNWLGTILQRLACSRQPETRLGLHPKMHQSDVSGEGGDVGQVRHDQAGGRGSGQVEGSEEIGGVERFEH